MTKRFTLPALALGAALAATTGEAHGFCRSKSCDDNPAYDDVWQEGPEASCVRVNGCQLEGSPLFWPKSCISFSVQEGGSARRSVSFEELHAATKKAFQLWLEADCGGRPPSFAISDYGAVECGTPQHNWTRPNANVIMFRDMGFLDSTVDPIATIALTTTSYNTETGEIYDADIELNSEQHPFAVDGVPGSVGFDLTAVLTHEVGHFLGLSHSSLPQATMSEHYLDFGRQRSLHADDVQGLCSIYPPEGKVNSLDCAPRNGFASECQPEDDEEAGGCAVRAPAGRAGGAALLLGAFALASLFRRRRRR